MHHFTVSDRSRQGGRLFNMYFKELPSSFSTEELVHSMDECTVQWKGCPGYAGTEPVKPDEADIKVLVEILDEGYRPCLKDKVENDTNRIKSHAQEGRADAKTGR